MKPMFIALKGQYFDAFKAGTKTVEYRRYCKRWDERTCAIGRPIVLSRGYSKGQRLTGVISSFQQRYMTNNDWVDCYGEPGLAACIGVTLDNLMTPRQHADLLLRQAAERLQRANDELAAAESEHAKAARRVQSYECSGLTSSLPQEK